MTADYEQLIAAITTGDFKALARGITLVENELPGFEKLLLSISSGHTPVVGITGPSGAGKSSLINVIVKQLTERQKRVAIIAVDPTSPFNYGSLLGDRIRMPELFTQPNVFIRSLATRGS